MELFIYEPQQIWDFVSIDLEELQENNMGVFATTLSTQERDLQYDVRFFKSTIPDTTPDERSPKEENRGKTALTPQPVFGYRLENVHATANLDGVDLAEFLTTGTVRSFP